MKSTDNFKTAISQYLENKAKTDALFAPVFSKENKNIDDCCTYIMGVARKLAEDSMKSENGHGVGLTAKEVFNMAVHYYDEDDIEVGQLIENCQIVVNHKVELTEEEKAEAKEAAIKLCIADEYKKLHKKTEKPKAEVTEVYTQASLFL